MERILFGEVTAPGPMDLLSLAVVPSLGAAARVLLGGPKASGVVAEGVRAAFAEIAAGNAQNAAAAFLDLLPDDVRHLVAEEDGSMSPEFGVWLMDGQGNFAAIYQGREALIGSGSEFVAAFTGTALRLARRTAADPQAPAEARYRAAAMLARPRLAVVE